MNRQANRDRTAQTRAALIGAGRELFGERGYALVGTGEIVSRAGVTRGALYHHFHDKPALFSAVFEDVQRDLATRLASAGGPEDRPLARLHAAVEEFLGACDEPAFCRIALLDAPALLGWDGLRGLDDRYALGFLKDTLTQAMETGEMEPQPVEVLAHVLMGAITECGMLVARAPDHERARKDVGEGLHRLIAGLGSATPP
jgi:AcrR family transcriptional regulator